jgi:hypothetical protein
MPQSPVSLKGILKKKKAFKKIRERLWKRKQQSISQVSPGRRRQQGPIFSSMIQDDGYRDYLYFRSESV